MFPLPEWINDGVRDVDDGTVGADHRVAGHRREVGTEKKREIS